MSSLFTPLTDLLTRHARPLISLLLIVLPLLFLLPRTQPSSQESHLIASRALLQRHLKTDALARPVATHRILYEGPESLRPLVDTLLTTNQKPLSADASPLAPTTHTLRIELSHRDDFSTLRIEERLATTSTPPKLEAEEARQPLEVEESTRQGQWYAILPPLIAVLLALITKRLLLALLAAAWTGALLQVEHLNPLLATKKLLLDYILPDLTDPFNLHILGFTICLVGMVHVILKMGGMAGLLAKIKPLANSRRATTLTTALMGGALFFDDYANSIVVGSTMRPLSDTHRISRAKLAYIVDSTSAPIAGLAILSTWIGYEVGLFDELARQIGLAQSGYGIFLSILPMRFYCILTLVMVLCLVWLERDFGPMLHAEERALLTGELLPEGATLLSRTSAQDEQVQEGAPLRWYNAIFPIGVVLLSAILGMFWSGWKNPAGDALPSLFSWNQPSSATLSQMLTAMASTEQWRNAFSNADNARVLFWSAVLGSITAITLALTQRILPPKVAAATWLRAIPSMAMALAILLLAWSIKSVCKDLSTSLYLISILQDILSLFWLPLITFLLAAVVAFSTGTSWGTMGILLPTIIPLAQLMRQSSDMPEEQGMTILLLCFSAVLDGAIFGDHCSPISDTTVMSSIATQSDHIEHVRTQAPYAIVTMLAAALVGYIGIPLGLPAWAALLLGGALLFIAVRLLGKKPATPEATTSTG